MPETLFLVPGEKPMPPVTVRVVARGPVKSKGPEAINRQLDTFKVAIERSSSKVEEAFVAVLAPGWLDPRPLISTTLILGDALEPGPQKETQ